MEIPEYVRKRKNLPVEAIIKIRDAYFEKSRTTMAKNVKLLYLKLAEKGIDVAIIC